MFNLVHAMRTRIMSSPVFSGERILGAILFEGTMDREVSGVPTARYLWEHKQVVPFLKVDKGLEATADGVQLMAPLGDLAGLLDRATAAQVFGTKMRSVIHLADQGGVDAIVGQQFEVGEQILDAGLVPILEPEVDITSPEKARAEEQLLAGLLAHLDKLPSGQQVMLKLTIPTVDGFYAPVIAHPAVLRVVALSGGYSRAEANERLARNPGLIASFSRALVEDLSAGQSDEEFDTTLDRSIEEIYQASIT
jgi:fructose-bisphosphate aldolase, class I